MSSFIILEPFCDIHLALNVPAAKRTLSLKVFEATWNGTDYTLSVVGAGNIHFDLYPFDWNNVVQFNPATQQLQPQAAGTVMMQVRFVEPAPSTKYHYLLARITVHNTLDGWWFGQNSLSVFKVPNRAHSQPSIYALFDKADHGGMVGDITAHGYVDLASSNAAIFNLDLNEGGNYKDRIRGKNAGTAQLNGSFNGHNDNIPIHVVELEHTAADPEIDELNRTAHFDATVTRAEKHNLLFFAEGFRNEDRVTFDQVVTRLTHDLFDISRHQPYPLLQDSFNVWTFFRSSNEHGSTVGAPVTKSSPHKPIVKDEQPSRGSPVGAYSLYDLVKIVGYPAFADESRTVNQIKDDWNNPASTPRLIGYENDKAVNNIVDAWKRLIPKGLVHARDTYYGFMQSVRLGDRESVEGVQANMITQAAAGDPEAMRKAFARHLYQWFQPQSVVRLHTIDPRRYAPELRGGKELSFLVKHLAKLTDSAAPAGADHDVGKLWDSTTPPNPAVATRQFNSAGLVLC